MQNRKKLTHRDVINFATELDYQPYIGGLCSGFIFKWVMAVLAKDEQAFYKRLRLLAEFSTGQYESLKSLIESVRINMQISNIPTQDFLKNKCEGIDLDEPIYLQDILDLPAFYEQLLISHTPCEYAEIFNNEYIAQYDYRKFIELCKPKCLETEKIDIALHHIQMMNKDELSLYLESLKLIIIQHSKSYPCSIVFHNSEHAIGFTLKYDENMKSYLWHYMDINDFSRYPNDPNYYRTLNTNELVESLYQSFKPGWMFRFMDALPEDKKDYANSYILVNQNELYYVDRKQNLFPITIKDMKLLIESIRNIDKADDALRLTFNQVIKYITRNGGGLPRKISDKETDYIAFTLHVLAVNPILAFQQALENLKQDYPINFEEKSKIHDPTGAGLLHHACAAGKKNIVEALINNKVDLNKRAHLDLYSPLHTAARNNQLEIVKMLIDNNVDINILDSHNTTALYGSVRDHLVEIVKLLVENDKIQINNGDKTGLAPLHIACHFDFLDIAQCLISHGAEIDRLSTNRITPLMLTAQEGHLEMVKLLLSHGADLNHQIYQTNQDLSPLFLAAKSNQVDVFDFLLKKQGINIKTIFKNKQSLLHIAAAYGSFDVMKYLCENGVDIFYKNSLGRSALFIAAASSHQNIVEYLLNKGADIKEVDEDGYSPILYATYYGKISDVKYLLSFEEDIDAIFSNGDTLLTLAAERNHKELCQFLLLKGTDINKKDSFGKTALYYATKNGYFEIVKLLLDNNANINLTFDGVKAVDIAKRYNHKDVHDLLNSFENSITRRLDKKKGSTKLERKKKLILLYYCSIVIFVTKKFAITISKRFAINF